MSKSKGGGGRGTASARTITEITPKAATALAAPTTPAAVLAQLQHVALPPDLEKAVTALQANDDFVQSVKYIMAVKASALADMSEEEFNWFYNNRDESNAEVRDRVIKDAERATWRNAPNLPTDAQVKRAIYLTVKDSFASSYKPEHFAGLRADVNAISGGRGLFDNGKFVSRDSAAAKQVKSFMSSLDDYVDYNSKTGKYNVGLLGSPNNDEPVIVNL